MKRRYFMGLMLVAPTLIAPPAEAQAVRMSASEIEALLAGNTIVGSWADSRYRQFFAADGTTLYVPDEGRKDEGKWRVNPDTNDYESWWRSTGWTPYALAWTETGSPAWINGDKLESFEVLPGRQID